MEETPDVPVAEPTQDPSPEETSQEPQESPQEEPAQPEAPAEDAQPSRAQERIRDTIARRKEAEKVAEAARAEAEYWKSQALSQRREEPQDELEGVTPDGIDPVTYARSLKASLRKELLDEIRKEQGLSESQRSFDREIALVAADPLIAGSESAQRAVSRIINAEKVSPAEALALYREEMAEIREQASAKSKARDEAGRYARESTQSPAAGRSPSGAEGTFTREQIDSMSLDEYSKNREAINDAYARGKIK